MVLLLTSLAKESPMKRWPSCLPSQRSALTEQTKHMTLAFAERNVHQQTMQRPVSEAFILSAQMKYVVDLASFLKVNGPCCSTVILTASLLIDICNFVDVQTAKLKSKIDQMFGGIHVRHQIL
jgi:hypothetical protein